MQPHLFCHGSDEIGGLHTRQIAERFRHHGVALSRRQMVVCIPNLDHVFIARRRRIADIHDVIAPCRFDVTESD